MLLQPHPVYGCTTQIRNALHNELATVWSTTASLITSEHFSGEQGPVVPMVIQQRCSRPFLMYMSSMWLCLRPKCMWPFANEMTHKRQMRRRFRHILVFMCWWEWRHQRCWCLGACIMVIIIHPFVIFNFLHTPFISLVALEPFLIIIFVEKSGTPHPTPSTIFKYWVCGSEVDKALCALHHQEGNGQYTDWPGGGGHTGGGASGDSSTF